MEGLHVEPVAGQNRRRVAPDHVGRGLAAAGFGLIDDVVVNERRGVDEFHHGGEPDGGGVRFPVQAAGDQQQDWPQAFPAVALQMARDE